MKLRLEGDGTRHGTYLIDENGVMIEGVQSVDLHIADRDGRASAQVTFGRIEMKLDTTR